MKRFVSTLTAWLILLGTTYLLRTIIASPLVGTSIGYWDIEAFALHFFWAPIITLVTWGLWIKHLGDERYLTAVRVMPSSFLQPNVREEVTDQR